jgi:hypothetical protein
VKNEDFPTLLEFTAPTLRLYPPESVIAEKLHALTVLGIANSRMKDFYDLLALSRRFRFEGPTLVQAIQATFDCRKTPLPSEAPTGLTNEFAARPDKQVQWAAFLNRLQINDVSNVLEQIVITLHGFLLPPLRAAVTGDPFADGWPPGGPWSVC